MEGFLGIDVSKGYSDFALLDKNKRPLEEVFQLDDTRSDHDRLKELLGEFINKHSITELYCGVESTGGFENNWYAFLIEMGKALPVKVARLNPSGVRKNIEAGLKRNVTDALSASYIAEYMVAHNDKVEYQEQDSRYACFRDVHTCLMLQKKQNTQLINELKMLLYSSFPEMMKYCKQSIPGWVLEMLAFYPTPSHISKLKPEKLAKIKGIAMKKAQDMIDKAKTSISSRPDVSRAFLIKTLARQIQQKQAAIEEIKDYLAQNCHGEEITLLQTVKGIGAYSAACIMIEIEDIKRFPSAKCLASYFGLHPELKESGDKKMSRMSKKGRPAMRSTLYMCVQSAVLHDPHIKQIYHRHRSKGKNHKQAIGVIMHKILRIIWGILSSKTPYNTEIDKKNQVKSNENKENKTIEGLDKKRRFQPLDVNAPISNRQNKKRKVHYESQIGNAEQIRDHLNAPNTKIVENI